MAPVNNINLSEEPAGRGGCKDLSSDPREESRPPQPRPIHHRGTHALSLGSSLRFPFLPFFLFLIFLQQGREF